MSKRVLVAMSGGIDSSVAAALLKTQGHEVLGVYFQMWEQGAAPENRLGASCCLMTDSTLAKSVCDQLEIPFYTVDAQAKFQYEVMDYIVHDALSGRQPNPCVKCNTKVKFSELIAKADELHCDLVATGHYAKIVRNPDGTETNLYRAVDQKEDQSYLLFGLKQNDLARALTPLGDLLKNNVRKMARTFKLPSQDLCPTQAICFIGDGGYRDLVLKQAPERYRPSGPVVSQDGHILGRHTGLYQFGIGQRKGVPGLDKPESGSYFVLGFDVKLNAVIVGPESELMKTSLVAAQCNWIGVQDFSRGVHAKAKLGPQHEPAECVISLLNNNSVLVDFAQPQHAITAGQPLVFYQDTLVIGGGWIESLAQPVATKLRPRTNA